jgi:hypothetical protein
MALVLVSNNQYRHCNSEKDFQFYDNDAVSTPLDNLYHCYYEPYVI